MKIIFSIIGIGILAAIISSCGGVGDDGSTPSTAGFGTDGKVTFSASCTSGSITGVGVDSLNRIVIGGTCAKAANSTDFFVARITSNGILDTTFDGDGYATYDFHSKQDDVHDIVIQADDKIVLGGLRYAADNSVDCAAARYNTNGSLDTDFDVDGVVTTDIASGNDDCYGLGLQANGKIVLSGNAGVIRYNSNGSLDTTFDTDGMVAETDSTLTRMMIQSDGMIVTGGKNSSNETIIFRYLTSGTLDTTFDIDGMMTESAFTGWPHRVVAQDATIFILGSGSANPNVYRYLSNGSLDTAFGTGGRASIQNQFSSSGLDVKIQSDSGVVIVGSGKAARYLTSGPLDTSFDKDGFITVGYDALAIQSDGKIVAASGGETITVTRYKTDGGLDK